MRHNPLPAPACTVLLGLRTPWVASFPEFLKGRDCPRKATCSVHVLRCCPLVTSEVSSVPLIPVQMEGEEHSAGDKVFFIAENLKSYVEHDDTLHKAKRHRAENRSCRGARVVFFFHANLAFFRFHYSPVSHSIVQGVVRSIFFGVLRDPSFRVLSDMANSFWQRRSFSVIFSNRFDVLRSVLQNPLPDAALAKVQASVWHF